MTSLALASAAIFSTACGSTSSTCDELFTCGGPTDGGPDGRASTGGGSGSGSGGSAGKQATGGRGGTGASGGAGAGGKTGSGGSGGTGQGGTNAGGTDSDGGPDAAVVPPCDESKTPGVESCLVADKYAVFVAAGGSGNGTKASPVGTITQGIANAKSLGLTRVIVCDATYAETVTIQSASAPPALQIFGGFHCPSEDGGAAWAPESLRPVVMPATPGAALNVDGVTTPVLIQGVDFVARDAVTAGTSSIAAVVHAATNVTLRDVNVTAGKGADGAKGADGTKGADGATVSDGQKGAAAMCPSALTVQNGGVWPATSACGSLGGLGGQASKSDGADGNSGDPRADVLVPNNINKGAGATTTGANGVSGTDGSNGTDGALPLAGPAAGTFSVSGFAIASGLPGTDGHSGQGGGGGGASKGTGACIGASGGAGGMGGCGGTHGEGGTGGGASVALLTSGSALTLDNVTLTASTGGKGGDGGHAGTGGNGKDGASGGDGDNGNSIGSAGRGGRGGAGGRAASGSGGTGGPSYALVTFASATLTKSQVKAVHANGGAKGVGGFLLGTAGTNPAPDGAQGASGDELPVP
jgi:hypothetical protein